MPNLQSTCAQFASTHIALSQAAGRRAPEQKREAVIGEKGAETDGEVDVQHVHAYDETGAEQQAVRAGRKNARLEVVLPARDASLVRAREGVPDVA